ncbi:unnamed protein product [Brassica rapa]|uniref:Uncharacterized protein n=1 Tax=Brassica campestris TaxID=3711 RepID=A0A8D9DKA5_BRACM|nr:unnamed protein product [Brassica rapa]
MFEIFPIDMTSPSLVSSVMQNLKYEHTEFKILKEFSFVLKDIEDRIVSELKEKKHHEVKLRERA